MCSLRTLSPGWDDAVIDAETMRRIERAAIDGGTVAGDTLMQRAGEGVVAAMDAEWGVADGPPGRAVVLCGPGNNGGDGYVVATLLSQRGWQVIVAAMGAPETLPADAKAFHDAWAARGRVIALKDAADPIAKADIVVDALFGIGLTRALGDDAGAALAAVPVSARRVAIDVPSGLATDTGAPLGTAVFQADLVVTFHAAKPVHDWLADAGTPVVIVDIGL